MKFSEFVAHMKALKTPVILLHGIRKLPRSQREILSEVASMMASRLPKATFRTGNAPGAETAFQEGLAEIDPQRLQYLLPYASYGNRKIPPGAATVCLDEIPRAVLKNLATQTLKASPKSKLPLERYLRVRSHNQQTARTVHLLLDTLKVVGSSLLSLPPASVGIFCVPEDRPLSGRIGHSLRVCLQHSIPVIDQSLWMPWRKRQPSVL